METSAPVMNWEPLRQRILSSDLPTTLAAVQELKAATVRPSELPLLLSALIPSVLPLVTAKTNANPDLQSIEHKIRAGVLGWISKLPPADTVRRYTPALVAVGMHVLQRDYEENAITANRILLSIFKSHRSLPTESVEPYLKFVLSLYQDLPKASQRRFTTIVPSSKGGDAMDVDPNAKVSEASPSTVPQAKSISSFRVLAECPLVVILIFQLYPQFLKANVPVMIKVMVEALDLRPPFHSTLADLDKPTKRLYVSALRDLVAAQAKTLSFLTYLLRNFSSELKPYEERLATNVVGIMTACPRESIGTRRELLVATRHLLNSDFRVGFFRHVEALLDERVLTGNRSVLKPLAYMMLSDIIHHFRTSLSAKQMTRVVGAFTRVLHDTTIPVTTQHVAIRTLSNLVELLVQNNDPNPQLGRDSIVRLLYSFVDKLAALQHQENNADSPGLMRVVIVGLKSVVHNLVRYRSQRDAQNKPKQPPAGSNDEVASAFMKLTHTEMHLIRRYVETAIPAMKRLRPPGPGSEVQREVLTYFASAFTALDGPNLRRALAGTHIEMLVDAIVEDPAFMVVPRHWLVFDAPTSLEFCGILLDYLVERTELLCWESSDDIVFFGENNSDGLNEQEFVAQELHRIQQRPQPSPESRKNLSATLLQLFERILKSLSRYPDNEAVVRRHLRRIVTVCLQSSMEKIGEWPENYCMLLRYIFRAISAGKFEESYRELLPLIPTVLNGLYRIICSTENHALKNTAIELCLTIPARLSSLLPHMNLLLRIIIPALDSNVAELVNLGLRTLEFWVDNLNPLFLYPEMSKQKELFSLLMQTLSRHLRPAPYQYGLLTVRLLGKLGGRNRQFLREPMTIVEHEAPCVHVNVPCKWKQSADTENDFKLPISLNDCVLMLKSISLCPYDEDDPMDESSNESLWEMEFEKLDLPRESKRILHFARKDQGTACFSFLRIAANQYLDGSADNPISRPHGESVVLDGLFYSSLIPHCIDEAMALVKKLVLIVDKKSLGDSIAQFASELDDKALSISIEVVDYIANQVQTEELSDLQDALVSSLCEFCCISSWHQQVGPQRLLCHLLQAMGIDRSKKHEEIILSAAFVPLKTTPRELSKASVQAFGAFVALCSSLYGYDWQRQASQSSDIVWDVPFHCDETADSTSPPPFMRPSKTAFRLMVKELTSPQQIVRCAAKFFLRKFVVLTLEGSARHEFGKQYLELIRQTIFSRSLRLLPLPQQVGIIEALTTIVSEFPDLLPLQDQHLLGTISELLKMANVADREMDQDPRLDGRAVDKDGYIFVSTDSSQTKHAKHATSLFFRRSCVFRSSSTLVFLPGELPACIELRAATVVLLHTVTKAHLHAFFESDPSSAVGSIRPHVIGLLFRSLTACPLRTVDLAHNALASIVALGVEQPVAGDASKTLPKLPKELLQRSIRPVLLHLREHKRLTVPLLRGLSRLLSLLSTWFNKTLGDKLLDHIKKWTNPASIIATKIWVEGDEPLVAAEIVGIFASLPNAAHFVEDLVKTCIQLESSLHLFKGRNFTSSPYRIPLARYLNKHPQYAVSFFFPRLKTPIYSELFQFIIRMDNESRDLRRYLGVKQCTHSILNVCFERPLAILRSEKNTHSGASPADVLLLHGIDSKGTPSSSENIELQRSMDVEAMEQQFQGFRLVEVLMAHNTNYFQEHNDIVRAFRYLWRSRGRFLRLQHEDVLPPRYHQESRMLATFLISQSRSFRTEDIEVFFELSRAFLQPSSTDFSLVRRFLLEKVTKSLSPDQWTKVFDLFHQYMAKDSTDELKILGMQFVAYPMLSGGFKRGLQPSETEIVKGIIDRFMTEIIFPDGRPLVCGERLRVELLKMVNLFLVNQPEEVQSHRTDLMQFCWGLLKTEDLSSKSWAYVVVCQLVSRFEMPTKFVKQSFLSLLKCHQQEGKELIRESLEILIPSLPERLSETEQSELKDNASQLVLEDGGAGGSQSSHILKVIVRCPKFFESHQQSFMKPMLDALSRIGLATNGTLENRIASVEMAELLAQWSHSEEAEKVSRTSIVDQLLQFSIRMKLLLATGSPEVRTSETTVSAQQLGERLMTLLGKLFSSPTNTATSFAAFDKIVTNETKSSGPLVACLEVISVAVKKNQTLTLERNAVTIRDVILLSVDRARENPELEVLVKDFVELAKADRSITLFLLVALEKLAYKAVSELSRELPAGRATENTRRSRDRSAHSNSLDENTNLTRYGLFSLRAISTLCRENPAYFNTVLASLLSLAKTVSHAHLCEASARQRQGAAANRTTSIGSKFQTPTIGILEDSKLRTEKSISSRPKAQLEDATNTKAVEFLVAILGTFESNDVVFIFSQTRKTFLQLVVSVLESSDNVKLLMLSIRIIGRFLLPEDPCSPLTAKERTSLMGRLATFDFANLPNSIESQLLADLAFTFLSKLPLESQQRHQSVEVGRMISACLLSARPDVRQQMLEVFFSLGTGAKAPIEKSPTIPIAESIWRLLHSDLEGLGGRFWVVLFVDFLCLNLESPFDFLGRSLGVLCHGNARACLEILSTLLPAAWVALENDGQRILLVSSLETLLSRSYHFQFLRCQTMAQDPRCINVVRALLNLVLRLSPTPVLDTQLLLSLAENYNCWHEALQLLEKQYELVQDEFDSSNVLLSAIRHCYKYLGEVDMWKTWARSSCALGRSMKALSLDSYGLIFEASNEFSELMDLAEAPDSHETPTSFEMDLWEERWVLLQKELGQSQVVSEFANLSESPVLQLECAWKSQEWSKVRSLCSSSALFAAVESGDPTIKMSETLLAVANGRLADVENLHAQTAQLCLYRWQLLPMLASSSPAHSSLFHFFHRLVEIRESGQIMVETNSNSSARTIPDMKNILSAWRHRLPNNWEELSQWEEIFAWRAHMFSAITSNFNWTEANTLATLHDRPWSTTRLAKTARKHGLREAGLLLLSQHLSSDERAINVPDAFLKLREQVLTYYNPESKMERHGGLNLINMSNLSFFDAPQKSELFRLKGMFLQSLQGRAKANQAYCHAVQICPSNARAWLSWGELCASLATSTEKQQAEQNALGGAASTEKAKEAAKKVRQYLSQAMGCFLEAMNIDGHEWSRIHIPRCLWMLTKDGSGGSLAQTFEKRATHIPAWVWLPWIPQLLTSLYRREGRAVKAVFSRLVMAYPQAVYYPLRAFYLERRDVDRGKAQGKTAEPQESVTRAEELMSLLRKSHASLWSSLEAVLEELIVKFRPSNEEDLLATIVVLLDRSETQLGSLVKKDEESAVHSVWKTLGKIAVKYFRTSSSLNAKGTDLRTKRAVEFKEKYKSEFELDFQVSSNEGESHESQSPIDIHQVIAKLRDWKEKLEFHVSTFPQRLSLIESSSTLAMFGCDAPDLWPGACDPQHVAMMSVGRENLFDGDPGSQTTSASAAAAMKAAKTAASAVTSAAKREGVGGDYGGGSSWIEVPGQYQPNSSAWTDARPSPELHAKLLRFEPTVALLRRNDTLVRRIGMVGSDGKIYRFSLNFALPYLTRTDERTAQTLFTLDKVFQKHIQSSRAQISCQPDPVIPVAQRLRLVGESDSRASLDEIGCKGPNMLQGHFIDLINEKLREKTSAETPESPSKDLQRALRLEAFETVRAHDSIDDYLMTEYIVRHCQSPENLYQFRSMFAQQWAINCLLQYAFSAAERSPAKVAFDCSNARVFSPEFRILYNHQGCFESQPSPFRLSPNIVRFLGPTFLDARFIKALAIAADAIFACRHDIDPIFRLLIRDDLVSYYNKGAAKSDAKTLEMERQLLPSVARNVATMHTRFSECAPSYKLQENLKSDLLVDHRVRKLVEAAQDPQNQCMMPAGYQGWI